MKCTTCAVALLLAACGNGDPADATQSGGNPSRGREVIRNAGCGSCHTIPGIRGAHGMVGPPLTAWSRRSLIAGNLPNSPGNLERWIGNAQRVEPGTAMPDLDVTPEDARDMAAYLYSIR